MRDLRKDLEVIAEFFGKKNPTEKDRKKIAQIAAKAWPEVTRMAFQYEILLKGVIDDLDKISKDCEDGVIHLNAKLVEEWAAEANQVMERIQKGEVIKRGKVQ